MARLRWKDKEICQVSTKQVRRELTKSTKAQAKREVKSKSSHQMLFHSSKLLSNNRMTIWRIELTAATKMRMPATKSWMKMTSRPIPVVSK